MASPKLVGEMLESLGAGPNKVREIRATVVGRVLGLMCHLSGWFARCTARAGSKVEISLNTRRRRVMRLAAVARI